MPEQVTFDKNDDDDDDDDVLFVQNQHAQLDVYSATSLKQQSANRHVAPLGYIILIQTKQAFDLTP